MSLNKLSQAFSESVLRAGTTLKFSGFRRPNGNMDKLAFEKNSISYYRRLPDKEQMELFPLMQESMLNYKKLRT